MREFFLEIAREENVSGDRLRFLQNVPSEAVHRANLMLADVVLDTYPYNGATTTLETLWQCIPIVTQVGEQFAARNSYTMLVNAGIEEGIARSREEYIAWGIRFGIEEELRREVCQKLKRARNTALLWDGKQFTRDLEDAYTQMWRIYLEKNPT